LRGALGAVVAFHGQLVLVFAGDAPFGGDVLGRHAHVDVVEGVVQRADHHVHHLGVAHAGAPAGVQAGIGRAAHVLGAAANGHVGVAQQDGLAGVHDGLQARAAQAVDVEGGCAFAAAAVDGGHARQVHVFGLGVDHMAKHHVAHILAFDGHARASDSRTTRAPSSVGGTSFQAAAKGADGGAHGADNDNFTGHGSVTVPSIHAGWPWP
jgi:hypothetical protein